MAKLTKKASAFISKEIKRQRKEGKPQPQAVAIAFSKARAKGFKVPAASRKRKLDMVS